MKYIYIFFLTLFLTSSVVAKTMIDLHLMSEQLPPYNFIEDGELKGSPIELTASILKKKESVASRNDIKIYTCEEPPLNFTKGNNKSYAMGDEVIGVTSDVVREILKRINYSSTIELLPWARGYQYAKTRKNVFLFSMSRTKQREEIFKWVGPIAQKKTMLFAKKGSGININRLEDAKKVNRIATMRDDSKEQYLKKKGFVNLSPSTHWEQGLKKLLLGRVDLLTQTDIDLPIIAKKAGIDLDNTESAFIMYTSTLYVGVSKATSAELVQLWQNALNDMKKDGTFEKIVTKWARYFQSNWEVKHGMIQVCFN